MDNSVKETEARKRLQLLFDDGAFTEIDAFAKDVDGEIGVVAPRHLPGDGRARGAIAEGHRRRGAFGPNGTGKGRCQRGTAKQFAQHNLPHFFLSVGP